MEESNTAATAADTKNLDAETEDESLASLVEHMHRLVVDNLPLSVDGVAADAHELPPHVPRTLWKRLGAHIQAREHETIPTIPGDDWISLRCDGHAFTKSKQRWAAAGVLEHAHGASPTFTRLMVACTHALMEFFHARYGYTQSDEITVLLAPATKAAGSARQPHPFGGRTQKLCSLAAATVSTVFCAELQSVCRERDLPDQDRAVFDCRVARYATRDEAAAVLVWRAYDCAVNGVSDAIYAARNDKVPGATDLVPQSTAAKLAWLAAQQTQRLPLPVHQQVGTYLVKYRKQCKKLCQSTGQPVGYLHKARHVLSGNLITRWKEDTLFPSDETIGGNF